MLGGTTGKLNMNKTSFCTEPYKQTAQGMAE